MVEKGYKLTELGAIPEEWKLTILDELGTSNRPAIKAGPFGSSLKKSFYVKSGYKIYGQEQVIANNFLLGNYYIDKERFEELKSYDVQPGDILISLVGTFGRAVVVPNNIEPGIINPRLVRLSLNLNKVEPFFIKYWLASSIIQNLLNDVAHGGTMGVLNVKTFKSLSLVLPPLPEQKKIVSILSSVDEAIEKNQAVINQIEVVKKGLMQQLLTKGIPGWHKEYKLTELGAIPEEWGFVTLKEVCEWIGVGIASSATHAYSDKGIPMLRNLNIKEGYINSSDLLYLTPEFAHNNLNKQIKTGDLITVRTGYPGISAVVPDKFNGCQTFTTLISRPLNRLINSDFLCYWINSEYGKQFVFSSKFGGAQQNLNVKMIEKMPLVLPPLSEQKEIASILTSIDQRLEAEKAKKAQLETLKKGLMQQLLTGKLRVKI